MIYFTILFLIIYIKIINNNYKKSISIKNKYSNKSQIFLSNKKIFIIIFKFLNTIISKTIPS